jgi:hypothetical protein
MPLAPFRVWLVLDQTPRLKTIVGGGIFIAAVVGHILLSNRPQSAPNPPS